MCAKFHTDSWVKCFTSLGVRVVNALRGGTLSPQPSSHAGMLRVQLTKYGFFIIYLS